MSEVLIQTLDSLKLGAPQTYLNLAVFPIVCPEETGPEYLTLGEAFDAGALQVTELTEGGSVPEIRVKNNAELSVLILDGEELQGAKQNRVANTTTLPAAHTETILDVSCSERARWHYRSADFMDSKVMMAQRVRKSKNLSVSQSLAAEERARSDQGAVWSEIDDLHALRGTHSPTAAMKDAFVGYSDRLDKCLAAFLLVEGQCGLVFLSDRTVKGMDMLNRTHPYGGVHDKIVKSYAMDLFEEKAAESQAPEESSVRDFIGKCLAGAIATHASKGLGEDVRIESPQTFGSALVYENACIHVAMFTREDGSRPGREEGYMRGFNARRRR